MNFKNIIRKYDNVEDDSILESVMFDLPTR